MTPTPPATARPAPPDDPSPIIAREGWPIVAIFVAVAALLTWAAWHWVGPWAGAPVGIVGLVLTLWCLWFFRDPARQTVASENQVVSPADGVVVMIGPAVPPAELGLASLGPMQRICVFMNVFNVHVNRSPVPGVIAGAHYYSGKFFNASLDKASEHNERSSLAIRTASGVTVVCVQIAGLIARRILSKVKVGDNLRAGQRYGLIRFGSRVDVYLPTGTVFTAQIGQKTVAGETIIATLPPTSTPAADR